MACLFVERLTVIDFSFLDARRGVVGESWIMDVELEGVLDAQGMVFDFSDVKKTIKKWIDNELDHKLVVPGAASGYYQKTQQGIPSLTFRLDDGNQIQYSGSTQSTAILSRLSSITPVAVAEYIENELKSILPNNISQIKVTLAAEKTTGQYYHYTHGLQKHQGNCQRIAHGHRSQIQIEVDGDRSPKWEKHWAELLADIYIGTQQHMVEATEKNNTRFEYQAEQGPFAIELPSKSCYLVDTETTVELIAEHIAAEMAKLTPGKICVKAFEGVAKGAIAYSKGKLN